VISMALTPHGAFREAAKQNVAFNGSAGASVQSTAFGSQTYFIRVCAVGITGATADGVRISVGDNPTATSTSALIPLNWQEYIKCSPGQKIAALANNTASGNLNITELSD
jgi:hypothetical protein